MIIKLNTKPLTVNQVWKGRRFKTQVYKDFEQELALLLPKESIKGKVWIDYRFYVKDKRRRDVSNFIKPVEDILVKNGIIEDDSLVMGFSTEKIFSNEWKIEIEITKWEEE